MLTEINVPQARSSEDASQHPRRAAQRKMSGAAAALIQIKAPRARDADQARVWQPISNAPFDRELELAVLDREGPHALVFACRRSLSGWINTKPSSGSTCG